MPKLRGGPLSNGNFLGNTMAASIWRDTPSTGSRLSEGGNFDTRSETGRLVSGNRIFRAGRRNSGGFSQMVVDGAQKKKMAAFAAFGREIGRRLYCRDGLRGPGGRLVTSGKQLEKFAAVAISVGWRKGTLAGGTGTYLPAGAKAYFPVARNDSAKRWVAGPPFPFGARGV